MIPHLENINKKITEASNYLKWPKQFKKQCSEALKSEIPSKKIKLTYKYLNNLKKANNETANVEPINQFEISRIRQRYIKRGYAAGYRPRVESLTKAERKLLDNTNWVVIDPGKRDLLYMKGKNQMSEDALFKWTVFV